MEWSMKTLARKRSLSKVVFFAAALTFLPVGFGLGQLAESEKGRQTAPSRSQLPDFVPLAKKLGPVVVNISTTQTIKQRPTPPTAPPQQPFGGDDPFSEFWKRFFGDPSPQGPFRRQGLGSGLIVERDGTILTNNHVIENAEKIVVKLQDDREFEAKVVGRDARTDIAVLKIDAKGDLPVAPLGDSNRLEVGEWIVAMGSPFGLANTITAGIVSAKGRSIGAGPYDDFIQTDASINPGNSGGPLANLRGEVVGISTAIFSRTGGNLGIGFAIPINSIKELLPELKAKGKVTRGWLGVAIQQVTPELAASLGISPARGALVASVAEGGPAAKAGIQVGDVIVQYDGKEIKDSNQLPIMVARTQVGKSVQVRVLRDKKEIAISVPVGELKDEEIVASTPKREDLGLTVQQLTPQMARSLGLKEAEGVVITSVEPQSPAAEAGLRQGDVILEMNRKPVRSLSDFQKAIEGDKDKNVLFLVRRGENNLFLALKRNKESG
jgi:serine protease Do